MKRLCAAGLFLALMIAAIAINRGSCDPSFPPDFRQFAYTPLVVAERDLESRRYEEALKQYKIALTRAARCGRRGVEERIRRRIGKAGIELAKKDFHDGWRFLEYYAITSDDFGGLAAKIEEWCMASFPDVSRFEYPLLEDDKVHTEWGSQFHRTPSLLQGLKNEFAPRKEDEGAEPVIPIFNGFYETWTVKTRVACPAGAGSTRMVVSGLGEDQKIFFLTERGVTDLSNFVKTQDAEIVFSMPACRYFDIGDIVIIGGFGNAPRADIRLVREYEKM